MKKVKRGFTLIEMLVALVVVAMAGIIVSSTVGGIANQTFSIERRQVAHWVGENHLVRLKLQFGASTSTIPVGRDSERATMADRDWEVRTEIKETSYPKLRRVEVVVFELQDGKAIGPLDQLTAFIGS